MRSQTYETLVNNGIVRIDIIYNWFKRVYFSTTSKKFINKPFPSEHPYASHIEKFAMIPKFDSPQDPKRGLVARGQKPISEEMPANAYDTTIVKKIKGMLCRILKINEQNIIVPLKVRRDRQ